MFANFTNVFVMPIMPTLISLAIFFAGLIITMVRRRLTPVAGAMAVVLAIKVFYSPGRLSIDTLAMIALAIFFVGFIITMVTSNPMPVAGAMAVVLAIEAFYQPTQPFVEKVSRPQSILTSPGTLALPCILTTPTPVMAGIPKTYGIKPCSCTVISYNCNQPTR